MLIANGRLEYGTNVSMFGLDGVTTFRHEHPINSIGGFPRTTSVPRGYNAQGLQICITSGSIVTRPAQVTAFSGSAPINQGISIDASGQMFNFDGTAGLGAIVLMTVIDSPITFDGSAGIYGLAFMDSTGRILYFDGSAGLGAILTLDEITGTITFSGSAETHSIAHLDISTATGVMDEASISAAVWEKILSGGTTASAALLAAGTAGDPWTGIMDNYNDDATFGAFIKKLLQATDIVQADVKQVNSTPIKGDGTDANPWEKA